MGKGRSFSDRLLLEVEQGGDLADRAAALSALLIELQGRIRKASSAMADEGASQLAVAERLSIDEALSDAGLVAALAREWLQPFGDSPLHMELKNRPRESAGKRSTGGKPVDWPAKRRRALENNRAARLLERLNLGRAEQERAIFLVSRKLGITRDRIFDGKRLRRNIKRARPDIGERELRAEIEFDPDGRIYAQLSALLGE